MKSENIERLRALVGDRTDDEALTILEVINDKDESEDWRTRYDELDKEWRTRYAKAFETGTNEKIIEKKKEESEEEKEEKRLASLHLNDLF